MERSNGWWTKLAPWFLVEAFCLVNLAFLTLDIYLAHSFNQFHKWEEYVPLYFSASAPVVLAIGLALKPRFRGVWTDLGYLVGWGAIVTGLAGVVLHLNSLFFYERTLKSLTYSAPFIAPLAYTGVGFLLVMNRMVDSQSKAWAEWALFFTLGGFAGNFGLTLSDHAENGFFHATEWVGVWASAIAVGFLVTPLLMHVSKKFIVLCGAILLAEAGVGGWGFLLHATANLHGPSTQLLKNLTFGAAPFAPLLFCNLALLGFIALWRLREFAE
ncbi:MAG TPA: hypothetical protein VMH04_24195 [Candidatus Solibacter sp.]|nr:hypothetical protein [Candidatus Solibacter sp.]